MIIKLNEVREGGEDFEFSRKDTEIAALLDDLIHSSDFQAKVHIVPAGQAFDLRGSIATSVPEVCSFCATPIQLPIKKTFHDILLIGTKSKCDIKGSSAEFNEDELEAIELDSNHFNVGEALHEQVALALPFQPSCRENCKGLCLQCGKDLNEGSCACHRELVAHASNSSPENAFSVLKSLKLN